MAGSINKVILVGNLGQDPQIRTMQNGQKVATFSLATSDRWKDKQTGQQKEQTEWHRVVVFHPNLIEVVERMVQKGTRLYLEGQLRTRKWQTQQGMDAYTTEVVLNGFNASLIVVAGGKITHQTPPPVDEPPAGPFQSMDDTFAAADAIMSSDCPTDDIPF